MDIIKTVFYDFIYKKIIGFQDYLKLFKKQLQNTKEKKYNV